MPLNKDQQKKFNIVCSRIAGGESLRTICEGKLRARQWRSPGSANSNGVVGR